VRPGLKAGADAYLTRDARAPRGMSREVPRDAVAVDRQGHPGSDFARSCPEEHHYTAADIMAGSLVVRGALACPGAAINS
jgi:hypothetical protein